MRKISKREASKVSAGVVSSGRLVAAMTAGAVAGALRGIPGGPIGMAGNAIFGAGMAAAGVAMSDAAALREKNAERK